MTTKDAIDTLDRIDDLFGELSNNLIYVCEESPSLGVTREVEQKIVDHCCASLERLVEADKNLQRIACSLKGNVDRIPQSSLHLPESTCRTIATAAKEIGVTVQSMQGLDAEYRSLARQESTLTQLSVILKDSGETLEKLFDRMRKEIDALLGGEVYHGSSV